MKKSLDTPFLFPSQGLDLIIPLYKNENLLTGLLNGIHSCAQELKNMNAQVIFVIDSPNYLPLKTTLALLLVQLDKVMPPVTLIENKINIGFIRSVNKALTNSIAAERDAIILNSDTIPTQGAFAELQRIAYLDSMIGFVSPRSNNATLCSLPIQNQLHSVPYETALEDFNTLSPYLPEKTYVPTAVGFCLYIKHFILKEFGLLDAAYGRGYNEENDLICRANRCGFRAVLANHAFVYHIKSASFQNEAQSLQEDNAKLLNSRYPEYMKSIGLYFSSYYYKAEEHLIGLLKDKGKISVVFNLLNIAPHYNGTSEAAVALLKAFSTYYHDHFAIYIRCKESTWNFHKLSKLKHINRLSKNDTKICAIAFQIGQPFSYDCLDKMSKTGAYNVYFMLDSIAWDCLYISGQSIENCWKMVFEHADGVVHLSSFTAKQFQLRFKQATHLQTMISPLSLNLADYNASFNAGPTPIKNDSHILIIGNHYAHKHLDPTLEAVSSAFPEQRIIVVGKSAYQKKNIISYQSSTISEAAMERFYQDALFIIFPSLYEGFGLPLVKALAYHKVVMVQASELWTELKTRLKTKNIVFYKSTEDLVLQLKSKGFPKYKQLDHANEFDGWERCASELASFFQALYKNKHHLLQNIASRMEKIDRLIETSSPLSQQINLSFISRKIVKRLRQLIA